MFAFLCVRGSEKRAETELNTFCISIFNTANIKTFATFYSANFIIIISFVNASSHSNEYEIDVNRMLCGRLVVSFECAPIECVLMLLVLLLFCLLTYLKGAIGRSTHTHTHVCVLAFLFCTLTKRTAHNFRIHFDVCLYSG